MHLHPVALFVIGALALLWASMFSLPSFFSLFRFGITTDIMPKAHGGWSRGTNGIVRTMMQVFVSLVLLGASVYIILSQSYNPNDKHWAYATAGTVLGFWLKR
jgi:hypothetical protein